MAYDKLAAVLPANQMLGLKISGNYHGVAQAPGVEICML